MSKTVICISKIYELATAFLDQYDVTTFFTDYASSKQQNIFTSHICGNRDAKILSHISLFKSYFCLRSIKMLNV